MNEFEAIYGPSAKHAEHKVGETINYHDAAAPNGKNTGEILHIVAATEQAPLIYVVSPQRERFPVEVVASDVIE